MIWAEVLLAMERDGILSFSAALFVVLLLILIFERSWSAVLIISIPLFLGLGLTIGLMAYGHRPLNQWSVLAQERVESI